MEQDGVIWVHGWHICPLASTGATSHTGTMPLRLSHCSLLISSPAQVSPHITPESQFLQPAVFKNLPIINN